MLMVRGLLLGGHLADKHLVVNSSYSSFKTWLIKGHLITLTAGVLSGVFSQRSVLYC